MKLSVQKSDKRAWFVKCNHNKKYISFFFSEELDSVTNFELFVPLANLVSIISVTQFIAREKQILSSCPLLPRLFLQCHPKRKF